MSKDSSTNSYQDSKEKLQKKVRERCHCLSKEEKEKKDNMVAKNLKISQKMKNKG